MFHHQEHPAPARAFVARAACAMALLALASAAHAQRDGVSDALAGHSAEMAQFGAAADPLRRIVYFDPVAVESAPAGVPCNHLASRRPEAVAGTGWVVLMESGAAPARLVRYWRPPASSGPENIEAEARHFARQAGETAEIRIVAVRSFAWCR